MFVERPAKQCLNIDRIFAVGSSNKPLDNSKMTSSTAIGLFTLFLYLLGCVDGMHVTVKGRFRCFLPVSYSEVTLYHRYRGSNVKIGQGTTDLNGAYSISTVVDESLYDLNNPSVNLFVAPNYFHESQFRGSMHLTKYGEPIQIRDRTQTRYGVKPGEIVDYRTTALRSRLCLSYYRLFQEMSDHARSPGPVPAQFKVIIDAPVPNIRVSTTNVLVPNGYQLQYSTDTRPMLRTFIRHNFDGSQRVFDANAKKFGYFEQRDPNKPTTAEYAFYWAWYRFNAGGGCPNPRPTGSLLIPQNVYLAIYNMFCACGFQQFDAESYKVFRTNPGQVLTFPIFEKLFRAQTTCAA